MSDDFVIKIGAGPTPVATTRLIDGRKALIFLVAVKNAIAGSAHMLIDL